PRSPRPRPRLEALRPRHRALRTYCNPPRMGRLHPLLRRGPRRSPQSKTVPRNDSRARPGGDGMNAPNLEALQRRMAAAVMRPLTGSETMRKREASGASVAEEADSFIKPNDRLSSFERLEIYNRQYWFRVFSSFEEDFPGLKSVVGNRRFQSLMRAYLEAHPSRSFT